MEQNDEDFCSTSISIIGHVSAISNVVMIGRAKHAISKEATTFADQESLEILMLIKKIIYTVRFYEDPMVKTNSKVHIKCD